MFQLERLGAEDFLISQEVSSPTNLLDGRNFWKHHSC